jgi:tripartite-type tricarboxylate transporter receptor subunit TctC
MIARSPSLLAVPLTSPAKTLNDFLRWSRRSPASTTSAVMARIEGLGLQVGGGKPEKFQKMVRHELALYARIVKEANIHMTP